MPIPAPAQGPRRRALIWDCATTSSVIVARSFRAAGWSVDRLGPAVSPAVGSEAFQEEWIAKGDEDSERCLASHPLDALVLHGDDQVRWLLARWSRLDRIVGRHLPDRQALEIALSKDRCMEFARRLAIPVLPTERVSSPAEAERAAAHLAPEGDAVLKADGGAAGSTVRGHRVGRAIEADDWAALTRHSKEVLVQRRIFGPRALATVVYDRGRDLGTVVHEKVVAWPPDFGVTASGVTRRIEAVHRQSSR